MPRIQRRGLVSHIKIQMYLRQTANGVYKMIGHVPDCVSLCVCVSMCLCVSVCMAMAAAVRALRWLFAYLSACVCDRERASESAHEQHMRVSEIVRGREQLHERFIARRVAFFTSAASNVAVAAAAVVAFAPLAFHLSMRPPRQT